MCQDHGKTQKEFIWPAKSAKLNTMVSNNSRASVTGSWPTSILTPELSTATHAGASLLG